VKPEHDEIQGGILKFKYPWTRAPQRSEAAMPLQLRLKVNRRQRPQICGPVLARGGWMKNWGAGRAPELSYNSCLREAINRLSVGLTWGRPT
jgi:hypothetical protein